MVSLMNAVSGPLDFYAIGNVLHANQDTFSHEGFPASPLGHGLESILSPTGLTKDPDATSNDPQKALAAAMSSYNYLLRLRNVEDGEAFAKIERLLLTYFTLPEDSPRRPIIEKLIRKKLRKDDRSDPFAGTGFCDASGECH